MKTEKYEHIIFFDGICNLCNAAVQFVLKYDTNQVFSFAPLQSDLARDYLGNEYPMDTLVYFDKGEIHKRSTGALKIAKQLKFFKHLYFLIYIPRFLRDPIYDLIAKNRYSVFGKSDTCTLPGNDFIDRFIAEYKPL